MKDSVEILKANIKLNRDNKDHEKHINTFLSILQMLELIQNSYNTIFKDKLHKYKVDDRIRIELINNINVQFRMFMYSDLVSIYNKLNKYFNKNKDTIVIKLYNKIIGYVYPNNRGVPTIDFLEIPEYNKSSRLKGGSRKVKIINKKRTIRKIKRI